MRQRLLDLDSRYSFQLSLAEKPGLVRYLAILLAHSGDSWFWILGLLLLWWLGTGPWKILTAVLLTSILITALVVLSIKFTVRRQRPIGDWGGIYRKTDPHSFPSGHAARAFMLAVMGLGLGPLWFGLLLLLWAPLVTLARVAMGVHYLSDVVAGAITGAGIGVVLLIILPRLSNLV